MLCNAARFARENNIMPRGKARKPVVLPPGSSFEPVAENSPTLDVSDQDTTGAELTAALAASEAEAKAEADRQSRLEEESLAAALAASLACDAPPPASDDPALRAALEASLESNVRPNDDEEEKLMHAVLAASLEEAEKQRKIDENIARLMGCAPSHADGHEDQTERIGTAAEEATSAPPPPDAIEPDTCPLCMEALDATEIQFLPCPCGFQLCLFCYGKIKEEMGGEPGAGLCPGCRKEYGVPSYKEAEGSAAAPAPLESRRKSGGTRGKAKKKT